MVDGGWAHVFCLFHGRAFWRDFLYCVRVFVYGELIRGVPNAVIQESAVLYMYVLFVVRVWFYGFSGMWL